MDALLSKLPHTHTKTRLKIKNHFDVAVGCAPSSHRTSPHARVCAKLLTDSLREKTWYIIIISPHSQDILYVTNYKKKSRAISGEQFVIRPYFN